MANSQMNLRYLRTQLIHAFKALLIGSFTCYEKLMSSCGSSKVSKRECPKEQMEN